MTDVNRLKQIASKGGEATKQRFANDPDYYKRIAKMGGAAGKDKKRGPYKKRQPKPKQKAKRTKAQVISVADEVTAKSAIDTLDALIGEV